MSNNKSSLINNHDPNIINAYFRWLLDIVTNSDKYILLLRNLHSREFYYTLDEDENRANDGKYLRREFSIDQDITDADKILSGPCSILEMLIALAGRYDGVVTFDISEDRKSIRKHFWQFMDNLDLKHAVNQYYDQNEVNHILDRWMFREYDYNGKGGLFPLKNAKNDQRNVPIHEQLESFCVESENDFDIFE